MRSSGCAISANLMSVTVASAASVTGTLFAIVQQVFGGTQMGKHYSTHQLLNIQNTSKFKYDITIEDFTLLENFNSSLDIFTFQK